MTRFNLTICEIETGHILDSDGFWRLNTPLAVLREPQHDTLEEALAMKDTLLARLPYAEVWIRDCARPESAPERFYDHAAYSTYSAAMQTWRKWAYSSWLVRWLRPEPPHPRGPRRRS